MYCLFIYLHLGSLGGKCRYINIPFIEHQQDTVDDPKIWSGHKCRGFMKCWPKKNNNQANRISPGSGKTWTCDCWRKTRNFNPVLYRYVYTKNELLLEAVCLLKRLVLSGFPPVFLQIAYTVPICFCFFEFWAISEICVRNCFQSQKPLPTRYTSWWYSQKPISTESDYTYPWHPCMVHLPTFTIRINHSCRYISEACMDGMGNIFWLVNRQGASCTWHAFPMS